MAVARMHFLSWWQQTWSRKRRAQRYPISGVVAYYWDGGAPRERPVRNISSTGAYLCATEKWYIGTILTITFQQRTHDSGPTRAEPFVSIPCKIVRQDVEKGVGVRFVLRGYEERKALRRFIRAILAKEVESNEAPAL